MPSYAPNNLIILDPSLVDESGHHLSAARAIANQCTTLGIKSRIICHINAVQEVIDLPSTPMFKMSGYALGAFEHQQDEHAAVMLSNNILLTELMQIKQSNLSPNDFVLFPVVTYSQVIAVCQWISSFRPALSPKFGLGFLFQMNWRTDGALTKSKQSVFKSGLDLLGEEQKKNVVCTFETEALSAEYRKLSEFKYTVNPIPTLSASFSTKEIFARRVSKIGSNADTIRIGFIGAAKPEKGIELMPDLIEKILQRIKHAEVVVHMNPAEHPALEQLRESGRINSRLHVSSEPLNQTDYLELISSCDVNVLPYTPATYTARGSALYNESRLLGIPVVVPHNTWMGKVVEKYSTGTTFSSFDSESICDAVMRASDSLEALKISAFQLAETNQKPSYVEALLQTF
ncbi:MAG: glycosyltransferase [Rhodospirillaceae bacterium]